MADVEAPVPQVVLNRSKNRRLVFIVGGVAAAIVVILLAIVWYWWSNSSRTLEPIVPSETLPSPSTVPLITQNGATYYYTWSAGLTDQITTIYRLQTDIHEPDQKLGELNGEYQIWGPYLNPDEFLGSHLDNKVHIINVATQQVSDLIVAPAGQFVESAAMSPDKKWITYTVSDTTNKPVSSTATMWLYNVTTQQTQQVLQEQIAADQVPTVAGWTANGSQIVLRNVGTDTDHVKGEIAVIDAQAPYTKRILNVPPAVEDAFLRGRLSPDGQWWLYNYCTQPQVGTEGDLLGCPVGQDVFISNIATGQFRSIFKKAVDPEIDSTGASALVFDSSWQDAQHVIVATSDGMYQVGLNNEPAQTLYQFGWPPAQTIQENPLITYIRGSYVIFDYSSSLGKKILDMTTHKLLELNSEGSIQGFL